MLLVEKTGKSSKVSKDLQENSKIFSLLFKPERIFTGFLKVFLINLRSSMFALLFCGEARREIVSASSDC